MLQRTLDQDRSVMLLVQAATPPPVCPHVFGDVVWATDAVPDPGACHAAFCSRQRSSRAPHRPPCPGPMGPTGPLAGKLCSTRVSSTVAARPNLPQHRFRPDVQAVHPKLDAINHRIPCWISGTQQHCRARARQSQHMLLCSRDVGRPWLARCTVPGQPSHVRITTPHGWFAACCPLLLRSCCQGRRRRFWLGPKAAPARRAQCSKARCEGQGGRDGG